MPGGPVAIAGGILLVAGAVFLVLAILQAQAGCLVNATWMLGAAALGLGLGGKATVNLPGGLVVAGPIGVALIVASLVIGRMYGGC